jgi:uncharacterized protein (TIGR00369 family)
MSENRIEPIPNGFELLPPGLGFTDAIHPCFRRMEEGGVTMGLRVEKHHCNMMGICHGGVLMTLADITAASGVNIVRGKKAGSPTINLSLDFISAGRLGQWLQADITSTTVKRRFGFCSGLISNSEAVVARFSGTFYLPDHAGVWKVEKRTDGILAGD